MNRPAWCVRVWGLAAAAAALLTGCSTPSINAIYSADENEVFTDDRVVGFWAEPVEETPPAPGDKSAREPTTRYEVLKRNTPDARWYPVRVTGDADRNGGYEMRLVRLGAYTYADFLPDKAERERLGERLGLAALPVHVIYPVILADERMTLRPLDGGKVKALLQETPKLTPHAVRDDLAILTGDSRQVQEFFRKVVETEDLFGKRMELVRSAAPVETDSAVEVPANTRPSRPGRRSR